MVSLYWVLDVEFPKELNKTLSLLSGHGCDLLPFEAANSTSRQVINAIYA